MDFDAALALARYGDTSREASAVRFRAARMVSGLSQTEMARVANLKKQAISMTENGRSFPNREAMIYLFRRHRIDFNYFVYGALAQLPGDVQADLVAALRSISSGAE